MDDKEKDSVIDKLHALKSTWRWESFEREYPIFKDINPSEMSKEEAKELISKFESFRRFEEFKLARSEARASSGDIDRLISEITLQMQNSSRASEYCLEEMSKNLKIIVDHMEGVHLYISHVNNSLNGLSRDIAEIQGATARISRRLFYILAVIVVAGIVLYSKI